MCGSTNLLKQDGVFVCQSCGTKYSVEEAKKMMVEGTVNVEGTVKIDTSSELRNLYEIARRAKDSDNAENAEKYYDMILVKDPTSWEATFYVVYFKAVGCKIAEIWSAGSSVNNVIEPTVNLIAKISDEEGKRPKFRGITS
jgi:DNA-directed RNA polymerase subunit M/transcription elongation factor TFIIS